MRKFGFCRSVGRGPTTLFSIAPIANTYLYSDPSTSKRRDEQLLRYRCFFVQHSLAFAHVSVASHENSTASATQWSKGGEHRELMPILERKVDKSVAQEHGRPRLSMAEGADEGMEGRCVLRIAIKFVMVVSARSTSIGAQ